LTIETIYERLFAHFGPQHWWPGDTPLEIMVGAVLTQNTNWGNVEKAINALKESDLLNFEALSQLPIEILAAKIRPSGYYNLKAKRLKNLLTLIREEYNGELDDFFALPTDDLRRVLLEVKGIGPETADSIVLYAAGKPSFVVDAYTCRILQRHNLLDEEGASYEEIQAIFMDALPWEAPLFNEYHALIVRTAKEFCKKKNPLCASCPLNGLTP